jgi:hypothetical protein
MAASPPVENLDDRVQSMQLRFGVALLVLGLCASVALHCLGASVLAHFALAPFFLVGTYGLAAAMTRTCGLTAMTGRRLTATGAEPIADRCARKAIRLRGTLVVAASIAVSVFAVVLLAIAR